MRPTCILTRCLLSIPIETVEAYYDELKAGPRVALCWWNFGNFKSMHGGLEYYDRTLKHHTPEHSEGEPYSQELLDYWHREYVALKMRMFRDVVHGQFRTINGPLVPSGQEGEGKGAGGSPRPDRAQRTRAPRDRPAPPLRR